MRTLSEGIRPLPDYESLLSGSVSPVSASVQDDAGTNAAVLKTQVAPKRVRTSDESIEVVAWHYAHGYVDLFFDNLDELEIWKHSGTGYGWKVEAIR